MTTSVASPRMFSNLYTPRDYLSWDMRKGVLRSPGGARVMAFPQELSQGLLEGLVDECGDAWPVVLQRCGDWWGRRQMERLEKEMDAHLDAPLREQPTGFVHTVLSDAWAMFGWGRMTLDSSDAEVGLLHVAISEAPFAELFLSQKRDARDRPVDALVTGALAGMLSHASGVEMAACELACAACGQPSCRFVIALPKRLERVPDMVRKKLPADEIIAQLRKTR